MRGVNETGLRKLFLNILCDFKFLSLFFLFQDLSSPNQYDTGVALTGLSCFVTPDLARDLANDIMTLVS